jgi:hypothetical protein
LGDVHVCGGCRAGEQHGEDHEKCGEVTGHREMSGVFLM